MVYAKKTDGDGNVLSLYTYNFDPDFGGDGSMSIITKEEYDHWRYTYPKVKAERTGDELDRLRRINKTDSAENK